MSTLENLLGRWGYVKARPKSKGSGIFASMAQDGDVDVDYTKVENQGRAYRQSEITYFCIHTKASTASSYRFDVLKRVEGEEGLESIPNHPLEMLIQRPNPVMHLTRQMLWIATISHVCITGNAYWYLEFAGNGEPERIIPMRPERVRVIPDAREYIAGYEYTARAGDRPIFLEPWEVVHFRNFHPSNDWYGLSDIEASAYSLEADIHSAAELNANLRNRGIPAMIVTTKNPVSKLAWDTFKRDWRREYSGYDNAGKTAFLEGAQIDVMPVAIPMRDLQRLESREYTADRLMMVHGIPAGLFAKNATEANALSARRTFMSSTIRPLHVMLAETIAAQIVMPFFGEEYTCDFESCLIDDLERRLQEMQIVANGIVDPGGLRRPIMTPNEFRKIYLGLDELPEEMLALPEPVAELEPEPVAEEEQIDDGPDEDVLEEMKAADLRKWRTVAMKAVKGEHDPGEREFVSDWISATEKAAIRSALTGARSLAEVRAVFDGCEIVGKADPLPAVPDEVEITDYDIERAIAKWNRIMPEVAGMLEAEVTNKRDFDA